MSDDRETKDAVGAALLQTTPGSDAQDDDDGGNGSSEDAPDPESLLVQRDAGTVPSPQPPPGTGAPGKARGSSKKQAGGTTVVAPQAPKDIFGGLQNVAIKLYRLDPVSQMSIEIGHWLSRPTRDWWNRAPWISQYSGGGSYRMTGHPPGDFSKTFVDADVTFGLPGAALDPLPMREQQAQETAVPTSDLLGLAALGGRKGGIDIQSLLMMRFLGLGQPAPAPAPAQPVSDPRIDALIANQTQLSNELRESRAELVRERAASATDAKLAELKAELVAMRGAPKESSVDKLLTQLPTIISAVQTVLAASSAKNDAVLAALRSSSTETQNLIWKFVEKMAGNQQTPEAYAKAIAQLSGQSVSMIEGMSKLVAAAAPPGSPVADIVRDVLGRVGAAMQGLLPMWVMSKVADKDPAMARALMAQLNGVDGSMEEEEPPGALPAGSQPPQLPRAVPTASPRAAAPPPARAAAPPGSPSTPAAPSGPGPETEKRIPALPVLKMGAHAARGDDPEKLAFLLRGYVAFCEDQDVVPDRMKAGPWKKIEEDPVEGLAWLLSLFGHKLTITEEYAETLRDAWEAMAEEDEDEAAPSAPPPVVPPAASKPAPGDPLAVAEPGPGDVYTFSPPAPSADAEVFG